jgi:hypothetical protein
MKLADELGYLPEVAEMMTKINMIRVSALSPRASVELMREVRSALDDQQ